MENVLKRNYMENNRGRHDGSYGQEKKRNKGR